MKARQIQFGGKGGISQDVQQFRIAFSTLERIHTFYYWAVKEFKEIPCIKKFTYKLFLENLTSLPKPLSGDLS